jgi:hypothetical protein
MRRNWALCGVVLAAGLVGWNEYRVWNLRHQTEPFSPRQLTSEEEERPSADSTNKWWATDNTPEYFRPDPDFPLKKELETQQGYSRLPIPNGDPDCDATIIDLTVLQQQTIEPPHAQTSEPPLAPGMPNDLPNGGVSGSLPLSTEEPPLAPEFVKTRFAKEAIKTVPYVLPEVPQYRPYSADPEDCRKPGPLADACKKVAQFIWGLTPKSTEKSPPEALLVMPRPYDAHYHSAHPGCPYLGGSAGAGSQYIPRVPDASTAGEELQDRPPVKPKAEDNRKKPKLDTMEIRPGDLPTGGLRKPF